MSQKTENLLETDRLEDVLEEPGPPQPVVVIQSRPRVVPWLLLIALVVSASLGSLFVYYRREVNRLRVQALEARRALHDLEETTKAGERGVQARAGDPRATTAADLRPADAGETRPVLVSAEAGPPKAPESPASPPAARPPDPATPDPAKGLAQLPGKSDAAPISGSPPAMPSEPPVPAPDSPAPPPDPRAPVIITQLPESQSPFESDPKAGEPARADVAPAPAPAPAPTTTEPREGAGSLTDPAGPVAPPAEPPLPSKEETERQIREEAARTRAENQQRLAQQQEDLRTLKDEERRQFRDELRMIFRVYGNGRRAGTAIEELSARAGRDEDPVKKARAYAVIGAGPTSQGTKVRQLRQVGVSEAVILDYLANGINKNLGTRDGPRSRYEVWVQAARLLLKYEPQAPRPAAGPDAPDGRSNPPASQPPGGRPPAAGISRTP